MTVDPSPPRVPFAGQATGTFPAPRSISRALSCSRHTGSGIPPHGGANAARPREAGTRPRTRVVLRNAARPREAGARPPMRVVEAERRLAGAREVAALAGL